MKDEPSTPPPETAGPVDERTPMERMTALARALVNVPKDEIGKKRKRAKKKRGQS